jgi:flagellar motor protein MotB
MIAISFGEHAPVDDNASPEGRARNRRIEIRLIPVAGTE